MLSNGKITQCWWQMEEANPPTYQKNLFPVIIN